MISFRPENVIRRLPWQLDSKAALGFLLILATFSLVGWLYLTQASAVTATSYRIDELRLELDQFKNQNAALALEIAQLEALPRIEARARELGFEPTTNVRYLPVANYPAPSTEAGLPDVDMVYVQDVQIGPSSWWVDVLDKLAAWLEGTR
jgi:hypothetical protein